GRPVGGEGRKPRGPAGGGAKCREPPARRRTFCANLRRKRGQPRSQDALAPPQRGPKRSLAHSSIGGGWYPAKPRAEELRCLHDAAWHEQHDEGQGGAIEDET